jgi:hypothetical protein
VFPTWIAITSGQVRVGHVFCVRLLIIPTANGNTPVQDQAGHRWTFSQSIKDVAPKEWGGTPGRIK